MGKRNSRTFFLEEKPMNNKFFSRDYSGMALVTVLILIIILTLLAAVLLSLQASQVRLITHDDRRTRARYAEEAAMVHQVERLRKNLSPDANHNVDGLDVSMQYNSGAGVNGTDLLTFSHDYGVVF